MYRAMSVIIMRPLALAAEFQLSVVRNSAQGSGMGMYYMNREIRHSMEVICGAMEASGTVGSTWTVRSLGTDFPPSLGINGCQDSGIWGFGMGER